MKAQILDMVDSLIQRGLDAYADAKLYPEEWDFDGLLKYCEKYFSGIISSMGQFNKLFLNVFTTLFRSWTLLGTR